MLTGKPEGDVMTRPWQLRRYMKLAEVLIRDRRLGSLGRDADDKLSSVGRSGATIQRVRDDLTTLVELLKAYATGEYRDVPRKSLLLVAAGILYFVVPIDAIPDFLLGLGYLDDLTVLTYVIGIVRDEIERFRTRPVLSSAETIEPDATRIAIQAPVRGKE
jgi:uncharacterized membrane protein YkvA (DUF1232 family)